MKRIITTLASMAFMFLAFSTDQALGITKGLQDGSLAVRVRENHTEHREPIQRNQFDQPSYDSNMTELKRLSLQSAREQQCKSDPSSCTPKKK